MRKVLITITILLLSGCHLIDLPGQGPTQPRPGDGPGTVITPPDDPGTVVVTPPAQKPDWPISLEAMAENLIKDGVVNKDEPVLLNNVKNNSNIDLDTVKLTSQLKDVIESTKRFMMIPEDKLTEARQALDLQDDDSLNTRSKAIGLARYLTVPYILYTTIEGKDLELSLSSQIMQVQTGELIWSGKIPVRLN